MMQPLEPATYGRVVCRALVGLTCALLAGDGSPAVAVGPAGPAQGKLVKYEVLGNQCAMPAAVQRQALRQQAGTIAAGRVAPLVASPLRSIKDAYPSFAAVAVDPARNEVVFTDESLFQVMVYDRLENTAPDVAASSPKRVIAGERTNIEFQSGVHIDGATGDIYAVNNDTRDTTIVFGTDAQGDVPPKRAFETPHGTFGIASADAHNEVLLTLQHDAGIVTYAKNATGRDLPTRLLQGDQTRLADPHGIAYDPIEDVIFVANFGSRARRLAPPGHKRPATWPLERDEAVPGSGTISAASVTVYRRTAAGDTAPIRTIEGSLAQLNWPTGLAFDPDARELFIANDMGASVLVFDANASGNVRPKRVLQGPLTELANPTGIALDLKNRELWVANFGGHSGTVYDLSAAGNTPPKRRIRNAPRGTPSLMIGNPGAVTYDTTREEVLVPN